jgi:ABC-type sugar transport system ATPase subunit
VADITLDDLVRMIVGRSIAAVPPRTRTEPGQVVLEVRGLSKRGLLREISFDLHRGEILGLSGLVGAGRTELARALFGDIVPDSGTILIDGVHINSRTPRQAIAAGIGLVPEDRKEQGLVLAQSVMANIGMPQLGFLSRFGVISARRERQLAQRYVQDLTIRTPGVDQNVMYLSGGNQQRVVIAKWLATKPKILIVDEPTRGVDIGAKAELHALLRDLAAGGMAILMISSDMPEVLAVSDRILVMHQGRIAGELRAGDATQEAVMSFAMGLGPRG